MYRELNDNEILYMINDSDNYLEILLEKYKPLISKICKKYLKLGKRVGLEYDDLMQIANISLIKCIKNYKDSLNTSFYTYIIKCITNSLKTELRKELTLKRKILNNSLSIDEIIQGTDITLLDITKNEKVIDPFDCLVIEEKEEKYIRFINSLPFEVAVIYEMKNNGFTTIEISNFLDIDKEKVTKSIQYARNRLCLN